jgi:hypothetical protein
MALNVNIIGRDSEGNLRALKVNSEGNLDFGQLETEIQAVKDNQGRLYGKYGEDWIPVQVDSEGRPIIANDVTVNLAQDVTVQGVKSELEDVNSELALIKSELANIKANQLSGDQKVTLKDASGAVVSPATEDKLEQVRQLLSGAATEAKLEQARVLLNTISNKDFATQATLEVVQSELALIKSELDNIKQNQTSGDQKVQQVGTLPVIFISRLEDRPSATEVEIGQFVILTDEELSTWVSNGVNWVEVL